MDIIITFLNILAWATIILNVATWWAVLDHLRHNPQMMSRVSFNKLDLAMVVAICWLIAQLLT